MSHRVPRRFPLQKHSLACEACAHPTASPVMLPVQAILLQLLLESNIFRYFMLLYYTKIRILPAAGSRAAVRHGLDARAMDEAT